MKDTIAAISTSLGVGAISIIRVSGDNSIEIVNNITKNKNLISKPIIIERKRRGNVKSIMVVVKLKKKN